MSSDYQYRPIVGQDATTGWPTDQYGHVLDKDDITTRGSDGRKARDLTSPYGALEFVIGSEDDFWCFDYAVIENEWIVLHSVINSETGSFIQDDDYQVIPLEAASVAALELVDRAQEWCAANDVRHTRRGWNQDEYYFWRAVTLAAKKAALGPLHHDTRLHFSDRQQRFGGKRIHALLSNAYKEGTR